MRNFIPRKRLFWAVSLGHLANDMFMSMGPVLLAFMNTHMFLISNTEIGLVVSARQLTGALTQPLFGFVADRRGRRLLGAGGVSVTVTMVMLTVLLALSGKFWLMAIPYVLSGVGSGAFHPVGASQAAESDEVRAASNLSIFFFLGQLGLALGPAVAGILLDQTTTTHNVFTAGLGPAFSDMLLEQGTVLPILILGVVALPGVLLMSTTIPRAYARTEPQTVATAIPAGPARAVPLKPFIFLGVMVTLRSLGQPGSVAFIPVLFQEKGWDPAQFGIVTGLFWLASGLAGMLFGYLGDHFDRRWLIMLGLVLSAPAFFLLPLVDGALAVMLAIAAGGLSGGTHSLIVVLAQDMIPANRGFASGATLGFIFGTGALGTLVVGAVADAASLNAAFQLVAAVTVVSGLLGLLLPAGKRAQLGEPAEAGDPQPVPTGAR